MPEPSPAVALVADLMSRFEPEEVRAALELAHAQARERSWRDAEAFREGVSEADLDPFGKGER